MNSAAFIASRVARLCSLAVFACLALTSASAAEVAATRAFEREIQPLLKKYCFDCHADGANKGKVAFDAFKSTAELADQHGLWLRVLKNTRAGLMPPENKPRPTAAEQRKLEEWIKSGAFGIDPQNPDPGRGTLRRLNRVEYRNTIRDLMGFDFRTDEEFPADDSGYGFDNVAEVLTVSPLLLEKYMKAAETIVAAAVPTVAKVVPERYILGSAQRERPQPGRRGESLTFYQPGEVSRAFTPEAAGDYRVTVEVEVASQFDFDPGRCEVTVAIGEKEKSRREFAWGQGRGTIEFTNSFTVGEHKFHLALKPLEPASRRRNSLDLRVNAVRLEGPLDAAHWKAPKNYDRFFTRESPPADAASRRVYAREVLTRFATRAFRRPADAPSVEKLVALAESVWSLPGRRFEEGVARAMVPVLASPRFVFRAEAPLAGANAKSHPLVDEFALATRLSYFLWSTMPDDELFRLAERRELRKNLPAQVKRLLADDRGRAFERNFAGQWLQVRDVEGVSISARTILGKESAEMRDRFGRDGNGRVEFDGRTRIAMREEAELCFGRIVGEDRSVLELIEADYTFLNERLAKLYNIDGVRGTEMRLVQLPPASPRGGVLTMGAVLTVTSNPTRTSPVKRGLFILDNILGTPPPPPPADIPDLEESEKGFKDREPTLRELLALHREQPLCHACHNRMDPLGLALENFNALGMWRDVERGKPVDSAGRLITGEAFKDVREMKRTLATTRRLDFYQCLTEKLLTYALGRGTEHYDTHTVDAIVARLDKDGGRFSTLLHGVIESAPFQKMRNPAQAAAKPAEAPAQTGKKSKS